jgi:hypothetical protein
MPIARPALPMPAGPAPATGARSLARQAGQATAELTGLVVVVALMTGALALVAQRARMPERPPVDLAAAAAPMRRVTAWPDDLPRGGGVRLRRPDRLLDDLAEWIDRKPPDWWGRVVFNRPGIEMARGFRDQVAEDVARLVRDPIGYGTDAAAPSTDLWDAVGPLREAPAYLRELRRLGVRDGYMRLNRDGGRLGARALILWVKGRAGRAVRRRMER